MRILFTLLLCTAVWAPALGQSHYDCPYHHHDCTCNTLERKYFTWRELHYPFNFDGLERFMWDVRALEPALFDTLIPHYRTMVIKSRNAVTLGTIGMCAGGTLLLIGVIGKSECGGFSCDRRSDPGLAASGAMLMVATVAAVLAATSDSGRPLDFLELFNRLSPDEKVRFGVGAAFGMRPRLYLQIPLRGRKVGVDGLSALDMPLNLLLEKGHSDF